MSNRMTRRQALAAGGLAQPRRSDQGPASIGDAVKSMRAAGLTSAVTRLEPLEGASESLFGELRAALKEHDVPHR